MLAVWDSAAQPGEDGVLKLTIGQILEGGTLEFEMSARH